MGTLQDSSWLQAVKNNFPPVTKQDITTRYHYLVVDVSGIHDFEKLVEILINYVEYLLADIEMLLIMEGGKIETFTIGKTYAISTVTHRHTFDGANSAHFTIQGIRNRFLSTYKKHGYHFLIGLVIITRHNVPPNAPPAFKNQQQLALALESRLIQYFSYVKCDHRIGNKSFHPGNESQLHAGGVIYLAVKTCIEERC